MTQLSFLVEIASKSAILLAVAFLVSVLLRRASASARHFLWTQALAALLLLPAVVALAPRWKLEAPAPMPKAPALPSPGAVTGPTVLVVHRPSARPAAPPWLWLWALGCIVAALRVAAGAIGARRLLRRASPAEYAQAAATELARQLGLRRGVTVLETAAAPVPLVCGIFRPVVVLPRDAAQWPEARLRMVLRHELEHVRRGDLAAQALSQAVCCLYWFHPLVWLAARRLRVEREHACDDAVLAAGIPAHEYAAGLLDLARGLTARRHAWPEATAMAETSGLEARVRALFDGSRNRHPLRARTAAAMAGITVALLLPLASLSLHAQAGQGALAGVVMDPNGARIPDSRVTVSNLDAPGQQTALTYAVGAYLFPALPTGRYTLSIAAPGFERLKMTVTVEPGQTSRVDTSLKLGGVLETITIHGQKPATAAAPNAMPNTAPPHRIRVGGNVQPARLLSRVPPVYSVELQQSGVQGVVMVTGMIRRDGSVFPVAVTSAAASAGAAVDPRLVELALDAVKQWRYQPTLLDGEPIETVTSMTIDFKLD